MASRLPECIVSLESRYVCTHRTHPDLDDEHMQYTDLF